MYIFNGFPWKRIRGNTNSRNRLEMVIPSNMVFLGEVKNDTNVTHVGKIRAWFFCSVFHREQTVS